MPIERRDSQKQILYLLKTKGSMTAQSLADRLEITAMGARQHLKKLSDDGLVAHHDERSGVGRPARHWSLTTRGNDRFPDSHAQLTVSLLESVRKVFGTKGLDRLIDSRTREQVKLYQEHVGDKKTLKKRVEELAVQRSAEGYMSDWFKDDDGAYVLVENHCPVCAAAQFCQGLCRSELELFREVLGDDVEVERTDHLLAGARRCAYRIVPFPEVK
ncbi:MAG: transcriptional regulator [Rhodospirillales bacterium]|nr:transcriptional regulator [Rhodospirillales bacterium]